MIYSYKQPYESTGNPAAEGTSQFFQNKIPNIQTYLILIYKNKIKVPVRSIKIV